MNTSYCKKKNMKASKTHWAEKNKYHPTYGFYTMVYFGVTKNYSEKASSFDSKRTAS